MQVIEGQFGTKPAANKASDLFQSLSDMAVEIEDADEELQAVVVLFVEGVMLDVASNSPMPDGAYMLLSMGREAIMSRVLGGHDEVED